MHIGCHQNSGFPEVGGNRLVFKEVPKVADFEDLRRKAAGEELSKKDQGKTRAELARLKEETEAEKARLKAEAEANKEKLAALLEKKEWKKVKKTASEILAIDPENEAALAALSQAEPVKKRAKKVDRAKRGARERERNLKGSLDALIARRRKIDNKLMPLLGRKIINKPKRHVVKKSELAPTEVKNFDKYKKQYLQELGRKPSYRQVTDFHEKFLNELLSKKGKMPVVDLEKQGPLKLNEKYSAYATIYREFLEVQMADDLKKTPLKFQSNAFKRELNKMVPILVDRDSVTGGEPNVMYWAHATNLGEWMKIMENAGANPDVLVPGHKEFMEGGVQKKDPETAAIHAESIETLAETKTEVDKIAIAMRQRFLDRNITNLASKANDEHADLIKDYNSLKNDETVWWNDIEDTRKGSKPQRAYEAYDKARDAYEKATRNQVAGLPETEKAVVDTKRAFETAEKDLLTAIDSYKADELAILDQLKASFEAGSKKLLQKYPLPTDFDPTGSIYTNKQMDKYIRRVKLRDPQFTHYLRDYFDYQEGVSIFGTITELRSKLKPKMVKRFNELIRGKTTEQVLSDFNNLIMVRNMYSFRDGIRSLQGDFYKERKKWRKKIDSGIGFDPFEFDKKKAPNKPTGPRVAGLERPPR